MTLLESSINTTQVIDNGTLQTTIDSLKKEGRSGTLLPILKKFQQNVEQLSARNQSGLLRT